MKILDNDATRLLVDPSIRKPVLDVTRDIAGESGFVAGAFVQDECESAFNLDSYSRAMELIEIHGGTPVIFQSFGLTQQSNEQIIRSYEDLGQRCNTFIGFELDQVFAPFGSIYPLSVYRELLNISNCIGAKHSSLSRKLEWQRLKIRNEVT